MLSLDGKFSLICRYNRNPVSDWGDVRNAGTADERAAGAGLAGAGTMADLVTGSSLGSVGRARARGTMVMARGLQPRRVDGARVHDRQPCSPQARSGQEQHERKRPTPP